MLTPQQNPFSSRMAAISESKTTRVFTQARQLRRQGKDIISLAVGEPDFETPQAVIRATRQALEAQATRYGPVPGLDMTALFVGAQLFVLGLFRTRYLVGPSPAAEPEDEYVG